MYVTKSDTRECQPSPRSAARKTKIISKIFGQILENLSQAGPYKLNPVETHSA
jgi:hypothetical protein